MSMAYVVVGVSVDTSDLYNETPRGVRCDDGCEKPEGSQAKFCPEHGSPFKERGWFTPAPWLLTALGDAADDADWLGDREGWSQDAWDEFVNEVVGDSEEGEMGLHCDSRIQPNWDGDHGYIVGVLIAEVSSDENDTSPFPMLAKIEVARVCIAEALPDRADDIDVFLFYHAS